MPPGLMSRRKSRHMVWEMGTGDWGMGNGEWGLGIANGAAGKCFHRQGKGPAHNSHSPTGASVV
jgi:hypothetical protein